MPYNITRHDNTRISIELDGKLAFELERENAGRGFWALYPVHAGIRGARITTDQYSNDLLEWVTSGFVRAGHFGRVEGGYVVPAPAEAGEFYISGTGYLCCRQPRRMVLSERPVTEQGIPATARLRVASSAECEAAGLVNDDANVGVFISAPV